jgi:2-phospho-L-lactate transferase/gluconeogenesis factor (CofD/UPF0052 family)
LTSSFKAELEAVQAIFNRISDALSGSEASELDAATRELSTALEALSRSVPTTDEEKQLVIELRHQTGIFEKELAVRSLPAHDHTRRKKAKFGYH